MAIPPVVIRFDVDTGNIQADVAKINRSLAGVGAGAGRSARNLRTLNTGLSTIRGTATRVLGSLAALAGVGGIGAIAVSLTRTAFQLNNFATTTGLTASRLQEMQFAASQYGIAQNVVNTGLQRFNRRIGEARQGAGVLAPVFRSLGIELAAADGSLRGSEELFNEFADAIARIEDPAERARVAVAAFDIEGAALVNLLTEGSDGLDRMAQQARALGVVIDDDAVQSLRRFGEQIQRVQGQVFSSIAQAVGENQSAIANFFDRVSIAARDLPNLLRLISDNIGPLIFGFQAFIALQVGQAVFRQTRRMREFRGTILEATKVVKIHTLSLSGLASAWRTLSVAQVATFGAAAVGTVAALAAIRFATRDTRTELEKLEADLRFRDRSYLEIRLEENTRRANELRFSLAQLGREASNNVVSRGLEFLTQVTTIGPQGQVGGALSLLARAFRSTGEEFRRELEDLGAEAQLIERLLSELGPEVDLGDGFDLPEIPDTTIIERLREELEGLGADIGTLESDMTAYVNALEDVDVAQERFNDLLEISRSLLEARLGPTFIRDVTRETGELLRQTAAIRNNFSEYVGALSQRNVAQQGLDILTRRAEEEATALISDDTPALIQDVLDNMGMLNEEATILGEHFDDYVDSLRLQAVAQRDLNRLYEQAQQLVSGTGRPQVVQDIVDQTEQLLISNQGILENFDQYVIELAKLAEAQRAHEGLTGDAQTLADRIIGATTDSFDFAATAANALTVGLQQAFLVLPIFGGEVESAADAVRQFTQQLLRSAASQLLAEGISQGIGSVFGTNVPGRAFGGFVSAGSLYRVNERSPEYLVPAASGRVMPALERQSGNNITVYGPVPEETRAFVKNEVERILREERNTARRRAA